MPKPLRLKLFADFGQIHVRDPQGRGTLEEGWTAKASEDRIAVGGDIVGIGAADSHDVTVDLVLCPSAPDEEPEAWDHVTECSLDVRSGRLVVLGGSDLVAKAKGLDVVAGTYRLRVSHAGLAKGRERIRIETWPARRAKPRVVKRWAPPPRAERKLARIETAKQAVAAALRGDTDGALDALLPLAAKGDFAASASAVQLLAYRDRWPELVAPAMTVIAAKAESDAERETCFSTCDLLGLAAKRLRDPKIIEAAEKALHRGTRREAAGRLRGAPAANQWKPKDDLRARFEEHVRDPKTAKKYAGKPKELAAHLFTMAVGFGLDEEVIARWDPKNDRIVFNDALAAARALARRGDARAWTAVEAGLGAWWPSTEWDVAPVVLLVDPELAPLLTAPRRELVLATPRGEER